MSFQQGQTPPQQGGQRTGFSSLPEGAKQALTGIIGVGVIIAAVCSIAYFFGTGTGKTILFETVKQMTLFFLLVGIAAFAFMWVRLSVSTNPSSLEMAVAVGGLIVYEIAIGTLAWVWAFVVSGSAAVINMTLN